MLRFLVCTLRLCIYRVDRPPYFVFFLCFNMLRKLVDVSSEVSRGRIRNIVFGVQRLDWTSGGEVSRGRFRFLCVYDVRVPVEFDRAEGMKAREI